MCVSFRGGVENMNLTLYVNTVGADIHTLDTSRQQTEERTDCTVCYSERLRITHWAAQNS